jgi:hypothetical protein
MRRILLLIYTLWKNGEEYDENKDKANAKGKKKQAQEHGPEDCLAVNEEHVEGVAEDENGQPSS